MNRIPLASLFNIANIFMQNANHNFLEMKCLEDLPISSFDTVCLEFACTEAFTIISLTAFSCWWAYTKSLVVGQFKTIFSSSFKTPPSPFSASLPPWTIGRILFQHKFPGHAGANLANFIVSHFRRIYSLIHHPGRAGPNYINPCHCSPARESQTVDLAGKICAFDPLSMKRHHFGWTWKVLCAAFSHFMWCSSKKLNEKHEEIMMTMMITRMVGI